MGIFGSLFGNSSGGSDDVGGRCMDCGMAGGTHTDWCPTAEEARRADPSDAVSASEPASGEQGRDEQPGEPR